MKTEVSAKQGLVRRLRVGPLNVEVYESTEAMGKAAADAAAASLRALAAERQTVGMIFATGASQRSTLAALTSIPDLPWSQVVGFHLDDYMGMPHENPASFYKYLQQHLISKVKLSQFYWVDNGGSPEEDCRRYAGLLRQHAPQLCLIGIGENGHLAFNDPAVADFNDPLDVKVATLDLPCRQQQANEGWFTTLDEVPKTAITLTIPALMRVPHLVVSVPERRKAHIVHRTLTEEISTRCPATILRTHPHATVYLDPESSIELSG